MTFSSMITWVIRGRVIEKTAWMLNSKLMMLNLHALDNENGFF